jgi:PAS domain S-box-containing protein
MDPGWQFLPHMAPLILAAVVCLGLTWTTYRRGLFGEVPYGILLLGSVSIWCIFYSLEIAAADLSSKVFWAKMKYLGVVFVPPSWILYALQFTGRGHWLTQGNVVLVGVVPLLTLLVVWTNEFHGLMYRSVVLANVQGLWVREASHGPWYWINAAYGHSLVLLGMVLVVGKLIQGGGLFRRQGVLLLLGVTAPAVGNVLYLIKASPFPHIDLTPFTFAISASAVTWASLRAGLFDIMPVAYHAVLEGMGEGVVVLDHSDRVLYINPSATCVFGRSGEEIIGQSATILRPDFPGPWEHFGSGLVSDWAFQQQEESGTKHYEVKLSGLTNATGRIGKLALVSDVTSRHVSEEEMRRAKDAAVAANRSKSEFLANMSHELRTPLTAIMGFTELVAEGHAGEINATQAEYLRDVLQSARHLLSLINDILDLSKVEAGKMELEPEEVILRNLLDSSLVMVREKALQHRIELTTDLDGAPETFKADERKLKQVMYNLLSNAVKFTPDGGTITVSARPVSAEQIRAAVPGGMEERSSLVLDREGRSGPWLALSVEDTGVGIRPEDLERIFLPFEQGDNSPARKYQGTGLGLPLTRRMVELHGGAIWAESDGDGKGSAFRFVIPVALPDDGFDSHGGNRPRCAVAP